MDTSYDVIVVGARCAGSPTAMLLARLGYRVLLVDRASFPSDTLSTHLVHAPGVAHLDRWGVLERVRRTGCPPIEEYNFGFGPVTVHGHTLPADGCTIGLAPRRTVLDAILLDAAVEAGAEVREGFNVTGLLLDDGVVTGVRGHGRSGRPVTEHARAVVGADGRNSRVARAVGAGEYRTKPRLQWSYYTYFSDLPTHGLENYIRPGRGWGVFPTNDGLTLVVVGWPYGEARDYKADVEANYLRTFDLAPEFAGRVRSATREAPFLGGAVPNFFRTPYGPGWALVGDAGYTLDPITAQGISDAFRDAEGCALALDAWLDGGDSFPRAMGRWHRSRDEAVGAMYEFTGQMATLDPPPPQMQQLIAAVARDPAASDGFTSVVTGVVSPDEFFAEANVGRILGGSPDVVAGLADAGPPRR